jgi:hypothetical protein
VDDLGAIAEGKVWDGVERCAGAQGAGEGEQRNLGVAADDEVDGGEVAEDLLGEQGRGESAEDDGEIGAEKFDAAGHLDHVEGLEMPVQVEANEGGGMGGEDSVEDLIEGQRAAQMPLHAEVDDTGRRTVLGEEMREAEEADGGIKDEGEVADGAGVVLELRHVQEECVERVRIGNVGAHGIPKSPAGRRNGRTGVILTAGTRLNNGAKVGWRGAFVMGRGTEGQKRGKPAPGGVERAFGGAARGSCRITDYMPAIT